MECKWSVCVCGWRDAAVVGGCFLGFSISLKMGRFNLRILSLLLSYKLDWGFWTLLQITDSQHSDRWLNPLISTISCNQDEQLRSVQIMNNLSPLATQTNPNTKRPRSFIALVSIWEAKATLGSPQISFILIARPSDAPQSLERHLDLGTSARLPQSVELIVVCWGETDTGTRWFGGEVCRLPFWMLEGSKVSSWLLWPVLKVFSLSLSSCVSITIFHWIPKHFTFSYRKVFFFFTF